MKLSIVTTMYYSAPYIEEFCRRVIAAGENITPDLELILVNDGSPDNALEIAVGLHERDSRISVIDLSRNFGHHKAIMTGIARARGELVFLIDCDLEEEPELLPEFYEALQSSGSDVIYGVQESRKGGVFERISGTFFYTVFNALSTVPIPKNVVTVRLMTRRYVEALIEHQEREMMLAGLWAITGFSQQPHTIVKGHKGSTTYRFSLKISHLINAVTSFSSKPLVYVFGLGVAIMFLSFGAGFGLIMCRVFWGVMLSGWPSLMVAVCFLGGLNILCIGIIGIYLSKVYVEVKQRPYTIIRKVYDKSGQPHE